MPKAPTQKQVLEAQRRWVPYHFLGYDYARHQSVIKHAALHRRRAEENMTRYGSTESPLQQHSHLLKLPVELLESICDLFDVTDREDIGTLASLAQTCNRLNAIVTDETRMKMSFRIHAPLQSYVLGDIYDLTPLSHARELAKYTQTYQRYITSQIAPHMELMDTITDPQPSDVPHAGWNSLLWAGELVRAKIMGLQVSASPDTEVMQTLTPLELILLMYTAITFQGCYDLQFDHARDEYIDVAGSGFAYLKALRSAYITGGPQAALNMRNGVKGWFKRFPGLCCPPEEVLKHITIPSAVRWESRLGRMAPESSLRTLIETGMQQWHQAGILEEDSAFRQLGIDQHGATTLRSCLKTWVKEKDPDRLPWNWEET